MTNTTPLLATKRLTIGWTMNTDETRALGYSSFSDGYKPGTPQVVVQVEVRLPEGRQPWEYAEMVFMATNSPEPRGYERDIYDAIQATGYRGQGAHFSLSVGDTVEVDEFRVACERTGWEAVA